MNRIVGGTTEFIGNVIYRQFSVDLPFAAAYSTVPIVIMVVYLLAVRRDRRARGAVAHVPRPHAARWVSARALRRWCSSVLYAPILYVARLSVNTATNYAWPPSGFTLEWWEKAFHEPGPREALAALGADGLWATAIALVAGHPRGVRAARDTASSVATP